MPQIFLTGATGYIGGQVLHTLSTTHPDYEVAALVRDETKAAAVTKAYPKTRIVLGDLDQVDLIESEAKKANVVVHAASNKHLDSVKAISRALEGRQDAYYIQVTGASVLAGPEIDSNTYGEPSDEIFDDLDNIGDLRKIIRHYRNRRVVDNFILDLGDNGPKTAIIFPPIIFGRGKGPVNRRSVQVPAISRATLKQKSGLYLGKGLSRWGAIHIADLGQLFAKLVEAGVTRSPAAVWNENGLFFAENGFEAFKDIGEQVAKAAQNLGYIPSSEAHSISLDESNSVINGGAVFLGSNGQGRALRSRKLLGWEPTKGKLEQYIQETVADEAALL